MNPFDGPPSSPPVSFDRPPGPPTEPIEPPAPAPGPEPRRGRMVVAVFATAGLLGAAAFGISELASADDEPELTGAEQTDSAEDGSESADDDGASADDDDGSDVPDHDSGPPIQADGELRFDIGDGEPIIIDLDDIDPESLDEFTDCIGLPGLDFGEGLPGLDAEQFGEEFDQFFEEMPLFGEDFGEFFEEFDPEQLEEQFDEFFGEFEFEFDGEQVDPEQFDEFFEEFDPEQFEQELGPLLESEELGELFDQFFEGFDPELFDQFFEGMPPLGEEFGEHEASRRTIEHPIAPDFAGGSWFPSGLDREQIESCLAELD